MVYAWTVGEDRICKAVLDRGTSQERQVTSERHFCSKCSAMLWLWDETWYGGRTSTSHTFFFDKFTISIKFTKATPFAPFRVCDRRPRTQGSRRDGTLCRY